MAALLTSLQPRRRLSGTSLLATARRAGKPARSGNGSDIRLRQDHLVASAVLPPVSCWRLTIATLRDTPGDESGGVLRDPMGQSSIPAHIPRKNRRQRPPALQIKSYACLCKLLLKCINSKDRPGGSCLREKSAPGGGGQGVRDHAGADAAGLVARAAATPSKYRDHHRPAPVGEAAKTEMHGSE